MRDKISGIIPGIYLDSDSFSWVLCPLITDPQIHMENK